MSIHTPTTEFIELQPTRNRAAVALPLLFALVLGAAAGSAITATFDGSPTITPTRQVTLTASATPSAARLDLSDCIPGHVCRPQ